MVGRIGTVAWRTFRQLVREKALYSLLIFALLMIAAWLLFSNASLGQESVMLANAGLAAIDVIGLVLAALTGIRLVSAEHGEQTLFSARSDAPRRFEFVLGRYLGFLLMLAVTLSIMAAVLFAAMFWSAPGARFAVAAPLQALYFIFLQLAIVAGLALLLSCLISPGLAAIVTGCVYVAGNFSGAIRGAGNATASPILSKLALAVYYLLPNFKNFQVMSEAAHGVMVPEFLLISGSLYALLYVAIVISASVLIFEERNL